MNASRRQAGFSLIEMIVAISIGTIVMLVVGNFMVISLGNWRREDTKTVLQNNTKIAVDSVANMVKAAKSVEAHNTQPDSHSPGAPSNLYSWSGSSGTNATLILAVPSHNSSHNLIYIDGAHTNLYTDNIVYYLEPTTKILYRRFIANQAAPGNAGVTTCPPSAATPACPADSAVVENVANLETSYINANGNTITDPTGTEAVQFKLTQTRVKGGYTYTSSYQTIATMRNK